MSRGGKTYDLEKTYQQELHAEEMGKQRRIWRVLKSHVNPPIKSKKTKGEKNQGKLWG